uniref:Uncharacterized protein n=1 Tax=Anguilla anguilla TaxID=7936 RepID=A0A0E9WGD8_ANGAN
MNGLNWPSGFRPVSPCSPRGPVRSCRVTLNPEREREGEGQTAGRLFKSSSYLFFAYCVS